MFQWLKNLLTGPLIEIDIHPLDYKPTRAEKRKRFIEDSVFLFILFAAIAGFMVIVFRSIHP